MCADQAVKRTADYEQDCHEIGRLLEEAAEKERLFQELNAEELRFRGLRKELYDKYSGKYGVVQRGEIRRYTEQELRAMRMELADTSLKAIILRFLRGRNAKGIYTELIGKLNGLIAYLHEQAELQQADAEQLREQLGQKLGAYNRAYERMKEEAGFLPSSDWDEFRLSESSDRQLYLANIRYPLPDGPVPDSGAFRHCMGKDGLYYPYLLPIEQPFQLACHFDGESAEPAAQMLRSVLFQMLRLAPELFCSFHLVDGAASGRDFGELRNLQKVKKQDVTYMNQRVTGGRFQLARLYLDNGAITQGLQELDRWMTSVAKEMGQFASLTEYNRANRNSAWIPYQFVAIHNFPAGFASQDLQILNRMIANGRTLGLFVLLLNSRDRWEERNSREQFSQEKSMDTELSRDAVAALAQLSLDGERRQLLLSDVWTDCTIQIIRDEHTTYVNNVVATLNQEKKQDNLFQNLFDIEESFGEYDSTDGLRIPFAVTRRGEIMEYRLGTAMDAHGLICGGTGSGKSTLLHMLISSIVMNYSPEDVEIWLADYKITEFYSYKTNTPPQIGFIGLSKTPDFSYAFIDRITDEMNRRQNVIAAADYTYKQEGGSDNITSFHDYRRKYRGIPGMKPMKRLIVIIDEFHVMSQHAQAEPDYKIRLENILAEARAMGISMLLSDQAIVDGLRGLSDKGKKQIKARIALSNYLDELKETLGAEKSREELLPFIHMDVGEVAMQTVHENEDKEEVTTIERARAIYINGACRYRVNQKARSFYHAEDYVADSFDDRVIEPMLLSELDQWEAQMPAQHRDGSRDLQIYLGKPLDLQFALQFPLLRRSGNNMMCVSGSEEEQMRILQAVLRSFMRQPDYEIRILTDAYASVFREYEPELRALAADNSRITVCDRLGEICCQTCSLLDLLSDRGNSRKILVVWLGLDLIADMLSGESPKKPAALLKMQSGEPSGSLPDMPDLAYPERAGFGEELPDGELQEELDQAFDALFGAPDEPEKAHETAGEELPDLAYPERDGFGEELPDRELQEEPDQAFGAPDEPEDDGEAAADRLTDAFAAASGDRYDACVYNAREDIARVIHSGPGRNVFSLVIYDSALALRDFREVRTSDFRHRIAFPMSDYEAMEYLDRAGLIRELPEHMAYYYNGRTGRKFVPYRLD